LLQNTKTKTQHFGDRLYVYPEIKRVEGSTYTAGVRGKAVLHPWLNRYFPDPFIPVCRNTAHHVCNFSICEKWAVDKVQELGGVKCKIMWSEL
jgi:hypothetical protein